MSDIHTEETLTPMKVKYATRIGKVLSKPSSNGGFSTALVYTPESIEEKKHGSLYFVIDISSPSPLAPDIAYNLIDIVKEEYYRDLVQGPAKSFENALKGANEEFAAIYKEGEKSWIGKTNITIAAISEDKLMAVQRGTSEMHLWRNGKMMNLSEGMYTPGEIYKPEETLTNIIEGDLSVGDKLIFSTAELFYYLSVEKLKRIVEGYTPAGATQKIANQLQEEKDIHKTNVIISEFSLPELIDYEEETAPEDNWIGKIDQLQTKKEANKKVKPLLGGFSMRKTITDEQIEKSNTEMAQEMEMSEDTETDSPLISQYQEPETNKIDYNKKVSDVFGKLKSAIQSPEAKKAGNLIWRYLKYAGLFLLAVIDLIVSFVGGWVNEIKKRPNGNKILLISVGVLAIFAVISTLSLARSNSVRVSKNVAVESLESAIQKRDAAKAAVIYEDNAKASVLLFEAFGLAEAATKNDVTRVEALAVLAEVKTQLDEVGKVKRIENPRALVDFASLTSQIETQGSGATTIDVDDILVVDSDVYTYDKKNNKVFKYNESRSEAGIVNSLVSKEHKLDLGTIGDNKLIFYAEPASIYSLDLVENSMRGVSLDSGNWNNATDIIAYTDKLYFLDAANNNIWKYKAITEGYTKIASYFDDSMTRDLSGATDFVIDGDVYILNNGLIQKYTVGQQVEFNLKDVPEHTGALGNITDIYTDTLATEIYVLDSDNSRVVAFDKESGSYIKQYVFTEIGSSNKIFVDENSDSLWVMSGTKVYQTEL